MKKNLNLYRGGSAIGIQLNCDGLNRWDPKQVPTRIGVEYEGGNFTLTFPIAPSEMTWQRNAFRACEGIEVDDFLGLMRIPEKHEVRGVVVDLQRHDLLFSGWKFALEARVYEDGELKETVETEDLISLSEQDGDPVFLHTDKFDRVLLPGQHMEVGVVLKAQKDQDIRPLADFGGSLSVTANVQTFAGSVSTL